VLVEETVEEERSVADWRDAVEWKLMRLASALGFAKIGRFGGSMHAFSEYFRGFERVEAVRRIFGDRTEEVLRGLRVELTWIGGYMWVSSRDGHLVVSARYLNEGDRVDVYLDVIHELVHVKQFMEGRELFDERYDYVDRPTEIEAYRHTVAEARRIGLSEERMMEYLTTEWMSKQDLERLAVTLGIKAENKKNNSSQAT
jgi:hypothetical protein